MLSTHEAYYNNSVDPKTKKPTSSLVFIHVARKTNRWPLRVFFGMLGQAEVNAVVLYTLNMNKKKTEDKKPGETSRATTETEKGKPFIRRRFIRELAMEMLTP